MALILLFFNRKINLNLGFRVRKFYNGNLSNINFTFFYIFPKKINLYIFFKYNNYFKKIYKYKFINKLKIKTKYKYIFLLN